MGEEAGRAIGFSFNITLDDKRQIVAQTHLDQDWGADAINAVLDKITVAVQRQRNQFYLIDLKRWLPSKKMKLQEQKKMLEVVDGRHQREWAAGGKKGEFKLGPKEAGERNAVEISIDRYMQEIAIDEQEIADLEKELGS